MDMGWPQPQPEAVEAALAWLRQQDPRLSLDSLARQLREAGYGDAEVTAAIAARQAELDAALPPGSDARPRAALILVATYAIAFAVVAGALVTGSSNSTMYGAEGIAALILAGVLLPVLLLGLLAIGMSGRLRRGTEGAMAAVLILPFLYLVVIAGVCVLTTQPFS
jgi:hypothetical protein